MKAKILNAVLASMMLATASVGGITASAAETTTVEAAVEETETETTSTVIDGEASEGTTISTESDTPSSSDDSVDMAEFMKMMAELAKEGNVTITEKDNPDYFGDPYYDTDGNATLIKSEQIIYNTEEMQFIAVTTKDGHVFYVLINYSAKNGEDNVYFLNKVDDYDLYALLYAGKEDEDGKPTITPEQALQAAEKANGRVQSGNDEPIESEDVTEDGEDAAETEVQAKPAPMNMGSIYTTLYFNLYILMHQGIQN